MNLSEMAADLENQIARNTKPWMRIVVGIFLLAFIGLLAYLQITNPSMMLRHNAKTSEQFGDSLKKLGIPNQAGPGK